MMLVDPLPTVTPVSRAIDAMQDCMHVAGDDWPNSLRCAWLAGMAQARWEDGAAVDWWQSIALLLVIVCGVLAALVAWRWCRRVPA